MTPTKARARRSDHGIIEKTETDFDDRFAGEETGAFCQELCRRAQQEAHFLVEPIQERDCQCAQSRSSASEDQIQDDNQEGFHQSFFLPESHFTPRRSIDIVATRGHWIAAGMA